MGQNHARYTVNFMNLIGVQILMKNKVIVATGSE